MLEPPGTFARATWGFCNWDWGFRNLGIFNLGLGILPPGDFAVSKVPAALPKSPGDLGIFPSKLGLTWGSSPASSDLGISPGENPQVTWGFPPENWDSPGDRLRQLGLGLGLGKLGLGLLLPGTGTFATWGFRHLGLSASWQGDGTAPPPPCQVFVCFGRFSI